MDVEAGEVNMASRTPTAGNKHQVTPGQNDDRAHGLREFAQHASALRDLLYDDNALHEEEVIFMDKHFQVLQMAYLRWKRIHTLTQSSTQGMEGRHETN
jgi:hypothetical protein